MLSGKRARIGASFKRQVSDQWWVVLTPNVAYTIGGNSGFVESAATLLMGRPWFELVCLVSPNVLVSIRSTLLPIQVSWLY